MFSNEFVRHLHELLPANDISFCSVQLRTASYIAEQYSDSGVKYVGSALVDPSDAFLDIDAVLSELGTGREREVLLQGHSFGTNVVKAWAKSRRRNVSCIFLAPADSEALQQDYESTRTEPELQEIGISWSVFGIVAGGYRYPIPIDVSNFRIMRQGAIFRAWAADSGALRCRSLVVRGAQDPIAKAGLMADEEHLRRLLPGHDLVELPDGSHTFSNSLLGLGEALVRWVRASPAGDT